MRSFLARGFVLVAAIAMTVPAGGLLGFAPGATATGATSGTSPASIANLDLQTAENLLALNAKSYPDALTKAVALAEAGTRAQATELGLDPNAPYPRVGTYDKPSDAALALFARYSLPSNARNLAEARSLDSLPAKTRAALLDVLNAFLDFDAATRAAYAHADIARLERLQARLAADPTDPALADEAASGPGSLLASLGIDFSPIFPARNALLEASLGLRNALATDSTTSACAAPQVNETPALLIDLGTCNDRYTQDYALLIDAGGDDTYLNNAGGSGILGGCGAIGGAANGLAGALIDLAGNDRYASGRSCGINGGGNGGSGFLLDAAGNDNYNGRDGGVNGGGTDGSGFLLDAAGNDTYNAGSWGVNGGGYIGSGFLLDAGGHDRYHDNEGGTGTDMSVFPKSDVLLGLPDGVGLQLDFDPATGSRIHVPLDESFAESVPTPPIPVNVCTPDPYRLVCIGTIPSIGPSTGVVDVHVAVHDLEIDLVPGLEPNGPFGPIPLGPITICTNPCPLPSDPTGPHGAIHGNVTVVWSVGGGAPTSETLPLDHSF